MSLLLFGHGDLAAATTCDPDLADHTAVLQTTLAVAGTERISKTLRVPEPGEASITAPDIESSSVTLRLRCSGTLLDAYSPAFTIK
jgi:hypothetical protein